jgi:CheY-like chemotaxis protein
MESNIFGLSSRIADLTTSFDTDPALISPTSTVSETMPDPAPGGRAGLTSPDARFSAVNRVLIVDADVEAAHLLATLLRLSDPTITTRCAHTARGAVVLASACRPDVAIIDLGTQAMNGQAVAGAILVACSEAKPLTIALSGGGFGKNEARLRRIFDYVLAKPVEMANLVSLVTRRPVLVAPDRG